MGKKKAKEAKPKSTYEQFRGMTEWLMEGMEKNPRNQGDMLAQGFRASFRTMIFSGWIFGKLLRPVLKWIKEGLRMVFGRKKKDKNDPSFITPLAEQQMAAMNQQLMQGGGFYPYQQQQMQQPAQGYPYSQQPVGNPPAPPMQQQMQQQVQQPMNPVQQPAALPVPPQQVAAGPSVLEQLMMADMSLAEHLKNIITRLASVEEYLQSVGQQLGQIHERLNLVQGVQPSGGKVTKFQKH